jgi:3-deoxy-D-manno-octulosonic-acid transferase
LVWAQSSRHPKRPLVWFHAPSVGEGLQAESVISQLQRLRPDCQIVYTHFSPSAIPLAQRLMVDATDFLPYDRPDSVTRLLAALEPDLLVFAKLDLWPELATQAARRGCPVAIVAGTVSPGSARLRWPARSMLAPGYRAVSAAAAVSSEDAERLIRLGVPAERVQVLGDPRFDSVARRVRETKPAPLHHFADGAPIMVAGSTWPRDETVLLLAFAELRRQRPEARLLLVPHEPTPAHLRGIERRAASFGLPGPVRLSQVQGPAVLLLVDRVGLLAGLYGIATTAYVGGGFGSAGLHSVLEPAAWGVPMAFGPRWENSRDAGLLLQAGAAFALPRAGLEEAARALRRQWESWIAEEPARALQGRRALEVVAAGQGASERSARMLVQLISGRPLQTSLPAVQSDRP